MIRMYMDGGGGAAAAVASVDPNVRSIMLNPPTATSDHRAYTYCAQYAHHSSDCHPTSPQPDHCWNTDIPTDPYNVDQLSCKLSETTLDYSTSRYAMSSSMPDSDPVFLATSPVAHQHPQSPIHQAASDNNLELMRQLLHTATKSTEDVNMRDEEQNTPLLLAALNGHAEMAQFLLDNRASVNAQNVHDNTALHEASWRGYSETVEILCRSRAKLHIKNKQGHTALHLAAQKGHNQCTRILLISGCKPNVKNNFGDTPLHSASRYGHVGVARILISAFANVNELNKNDDTALHIASAMGRKKLAKILLESGCNPTILNKQGDTPMNIALRKEFLEIQELIASPPPLKPIYLKQQELYVRPLQSSYRDIYCALPKSDTNCSTATAAAHSQQNTSQHNPHHHHHHRSNQQQHRKSRHRSEYPKRCKSDFSNSGHHQTPMYDAPECGGGQCAPTTSARPDSSERTHSKPAARHKTSMSRYYSSMLLRQASPYELEQQRPLSPHHEPFTHLSDFPQPKLETLPTEPLEKGEQYFVDLSGRIHKGPIKAETTAKAGKNRSRPTKK